MSTQLLALRGMFAELVQLINAQDDEAILSMLLEAGIEPDGCLGLEPAAYENDEIMLRWLFGQWLVACRDRSPSRNMMGHGTRRLAVDKGWLTHEQAYA